jgi:hypothetical protein
LNKVTACAIGFSALLMTGLTACGGAPADNSNQSSVQESLAASVTSPPSSSETPSPSATPARTYKSSELAVLVGQLTDAKGVKLAVMSSSDLTGSLAQTRALLSSMSVEPAECQEMALAGTAPSVEGATVAMGTSLDAADGASTAVSMTSGLDPALLARGMAQTGELSKCAKMSIAMADTKFDVGITMIDGLGSVPGTLAYRTDTTLSDGRKQSMITAQAVVHNVLITVASAGGATAEGAISRAGAMLDQAGAQIR